MKVKIRFVAMALAFFSNNIPSIAQSTEPIYQPDFTWSETGTFNKSTYPYKIQIISLKTNLEHIDSDNDWRKPFYQRLTTTEFNTQVNQNLRNFFKGKGFNIVEKGYTGDDTIKIGLYINWIMAGLSVSSNGPSLSSTGQRYFPIPTKEEHSFKFDIYDAKTGADSNAMSPYNTSGLLGAISTNSNYLVSYDKQIVEYNKSKFCGGFIKSIAMVGMSDVNSIALNPYFYNTNIKLLEKQIKLYFTYIWQNWSTQTMEKWLPDPEGKMKAPRKPIDAD
jgi:hypothetical protein